MELLRLGVLVAYATRYDGIGLIQFFYTVIINDTNEKSQLYTNNQIEDTNSYQLLNMLI